VRDVAVSVSLSANTATDQVDGAIAHPAQGNPAPGEPLQGL